MSADASTTFEWADDERTFRLPYGQIRELERVLTIYATDRDGSLLLNTFGNAAVAYSGGIQRVFERLCDGGYLVEDIRQTLRLGLIGGGMEKVAAKQLVDRTVVPPLVPHIESAARVLRATLIGVPEDPLPKRPAAETQTETTTAPVVSASAASTETVPQSE